MAYQSVNKLFELLGAIRKDPSGFPTLKADSNISFDDATRTFTIQPAVTSFDVYVHGKRFIKSSPETLVIPDVSANYFIYYDLTGTLTSTTTFSYDIIEIYAFVAEVIWDAIDGVGVIVADERHGAFWPGSLHSYAHRHFGAQYASGFGVSGITADDTGDNDAHAILQMSGGLFDDEDLPHTATDGTGGGYMEQDLTGSGKAKLPVLYLTGSGGQLRRRNDGVDWQASTAYVAGDRVNALTGT